MKIARALVKGDRMKNLRILLADHPGSLAAMAETLGSAGISIEGGGMFVADGKGIANFLVENGPAARRALEAAGIEVIRQDDVVIQRLNQDEPGQLGKLLRRMAQANVNVVTQYSDHNHQLVLVVDDAQAAQAVSDAWMQERSVRGKAGTAALPAKTRSHHYEVNVLWTGNKGAGTSGYTGYERSHDISSAQKAVIGGSVIGGSSDPAFRGDRTRYNPEELLVASASACHMLSYLHLCALNGVVVVSYEDQATGEMEEVIGGPGAFVQVDLHPMVTISAASDAQRAEALHEEAHKNCFIANSLKVPVITHPMIVTHHGDQ
jgi:organic hydroperoxide reductase OsmC/OhrA